MTLALAVALAAGLGAVLRYVTDQVVAHRTGGAFPWGTLVVNLSGSLLLGLVAGLSASGELAAGPAVVLGTGFAGGYTTLSTWAWETLALAERGRLEGAVLNLLGSLALGLAAAGAGLALAGL
ncbi:MAG: fluoride efflux transporter CrcB [Actinomycetota bacterium]|nr:fluoride efflux transporter CrcB [Actinomycetota bacterium]